MKGLVGFFFGAALFGAAIAIVYWFASHDYTGSLLLGFMCIGLSWFSIWAFWNERKAQLPGDDRAGSHREAAGMDVTVVTKESPWPIALAFSILWFLIGVIWDDFMLVSGIAAMLFCLWRLGGESARVGHERIRTPEGQEQDVT